MTSPMCRLLQRPELNTLYGVDLSLVRPWSTVKYQLVLSLLLRYC